MPNILSSNNFPSYAKSTLRTIYGVIYEKEHKISTLRPPLKKLGLYHIFGKINGNL